jgi:hypothetical protein
MALPPLPFDPNFWITYYDNLANIVAGIDNINDLDLQRNAWMVNRNVILPVIDGFVAAHIAPELLPNLLPQQRAQLNMLVLNLYPLIREILRLDGNLAVAFFNRRQQILAQQNPQGNGKRKRRY